MSLAVVECLNSIHDALGLVFITEKEGETKTIALYKNQKGF